MTQNNQTYVSQPVTFIGTPQQRTGTTTTKDHRLINCFAETVKGNRSQSPKVYMVERAGLQYVRSTTAGTARGIYYFNGSIWSAVGNQLYRDSTPVQTLGTSTGSVGFVEYAGSVSFPRNLVVLDGVNGFVINLANVITQITDPDFPTPHVPFGAYMDGYLFVVKAGTADVYNSNVDNPTLWTAGDFITAEMFPDPVVSLIRQTNYIVAVGSNTIEYFYNAATFPGTPLARNSAAQHQIGTVSPESTIVAEEQVMMLGQTQLGGRSIWVIDGFKPVEIGVEEIRTSLDAEGTNITNAKMFCVRSMGHRFLAVQLTNRTWVFDFEEKLWHEWRDYSLTNKFICDYVTDHPSGSAHMQDRTTGFIYKFTDNTAVDATGVATTSPITIQATSEKIDFGTMDRKFGSKFTLMCDIPTDTSVTASLEWSDDDYQTWTTPRSIVLNTTMPSITQLGMFRRRAFRLTYSQAFPLRIELAKFDVNIGNQ